MSYQQTKWYKDLKYGNSECIYCGEIIDVDSFTVDHIIPKAKGGKDTPENCKPSCKFCNTLKAHTDYEDFIKQYPKDRLLQLKKYTDSNRQLNESEFLEDVIERVVRAYDLLESVQRDFDERSEIMPLYDKMLRDICEKSALDDDKNAAEGYYVYVKMRDIQRNKMRVYAEKRLLASFSDRYNKGTKKHIKELLQGIKDKNKKIKNTSYKPVLQDDVREHIEKSVMTQVAESNEPHVVRYANLNDRNRQLKTLKLIYRDVQVDGNINTITCKGKKI